MVIYMDIDNEDHAWKEEKQADGHQVRNLAPTARKGIERGIGRYNFLLT